MDVKPSGWEEGIWAAYTFGDCFVSPPVNGWVMVVSTELPSAGDPRHPNVISPFLKSLSQELRCEVQYFGSHRVVEYQAWMKADCGVIARGFAYLGESGAILMNEGTPTQAEQDFDLVFKDEDDMFSRERFPDEEDVMRVAGRWSINPQTFEGATREGGLGYLGTLGD